MLTIQWDVLGPVSRGAHWRMLEEPVCMEIKESSSGLRVSDSSDVALRF